MNVLNSALIYIALTFRVWGPKNAVVRIGAFQKFPVSTRHCFQVGNRNPLVETNDNGGLVDAREVAIYEQSSIYLDTQTPPR